MRATRRAEAARAGPLRAASAGIIGCVTAAGALTKALGTPPVVAVVAAGTACRLPLSVSVARRASAAAPATTNELGGVVYDATVRAAASSADVAAGDAS